MGKVVRILHLADLHLGYEPRFLGPRAQAFQAERDRVLERAVDFALQPESGVQLVVIAGDLFETHRPPARLVEHVLAQLRRLVAAGIPVVTVPGNHDEITYHDSVYLERRQEWPGVLVTNPLPEHVATLEVAGVPVHLYSLAYRGGVTPTRPPLDRFPRVEGQGVHLAVFHGTLDSLGLPPDETGRSLPLRADALARAEYDYIALGHIHARHEIRVGRSLAVYPGPVEGKGFDDPGAGVWQLVDLTPGGQVRLETVPAGQRPIETLALDVTGLEGPENLEAVLRARANPEAILRVRLTGALGFPVDPEALVERLRDRFYHLEIVDETMSLSPALLAAWAQEPTVRGELVRRLQARWEAADEAERPVIALALRYGLAALKGGAGR